MQNYGQMVALFEKANTSFLTHESDLIRSGVNERTLCGALMLHLHDLVKEDSSLNGYYTDVEYNRNKNRTIKTVLEERNKVEVIVRINCDLILHSRGQHPGQDNLIAIEMKKSNRPKKTKDKDRERLKALTSDSFDDTWTFDGHTLPDHVCRYVLGVYYEIDTRRNQAIIEYYKKGQLKETRTPKISEGKVKLPTIECN